MNIIVNGFFDKQFAQIVENISHRLTFDFCLFIYNQHPFQIKAKKLNHLCRSEIYPDAAYQVDWSKIHPLDENIVNQMADCEIKALKMMDRLERSKEHLYSYEERKRIYLRHLRYWNHVLEEKKIQLFVSSTPPHEVYDYIIYCLCRQRNIPTIFFATLSQFKAAAAIQSQVDDEFIKIPQKILAKKKNFSVTPFVKEACALQSLKKESPIFLYHSLENFAQISIWYRMFKFWENSLLKIWQRIITNPFYFFHRLFYTDFAVKKITEYFWLLIMEVKERRLFRFYEYHARWPDLTKKYLYVPLNFQPEESTSPMAGAYADQLLMVQLLSYYLPDDIYLYVKEHPLQKIISRSQKFYEDLLETRGVKLIPRKCDTFKLTENSLAVALCAGTPGWEALFRQKPVILFGNDFYSGFPGVFRVRNLSECQNAINVILRGKIKPSKKNMEQALGQLEHKIIKGIIDVDYRRFSGISMSESTANVTVALLKKIRQLNLP